ncbi:hypothetical protein GCM10019016_025540 [Streptomyces prasinosporus]|uniref:Uncharacterized protein n=1 Tax=Streptomyces prasinosporus TaxID=68256 RepID=A0ABP6TLN7_9ACTN|nr:hypothetical protein GCM10010332_28820 [Streptomyces albogriseolus]
MLVPGPAVARARDRMRHLVGDPFTHPVRGPVALPGRSRAVRRARTRRVPGPWAGRVPVPGTGRGPYPGAGWYVVRKTRARHCASPGTGAGLRRGRTRCPAGGSCARRPEGRAGWPALPGRIRCRSRSGLRAGRPGVEATGGGPASVRPPPFWVP